MEMYKRQAKAALAAQFANNRLHKKTGPQRAGVSDAYPGDYLLR